MTRLTEFWNSEVDKEAKHFTGLMDPRKMASIIDRCERLLFDNLDFSLIRTCLDWGCGGGLLAKRLEGRVENLVLADISMESLNEARKLLGPDRARFLLLVENPNDFIYEGPPVDLVLCHAVIHHFPSLDHYEAVLDAWAKLSPRFAALQVKLGAVTTQNRDYFKGNNFLNGLHLRHSDLLDSFGKRGFIRVAGVETPNRDGSATLGYFVFRRE
jgi:SAM-dependent methyltransferase